MKCSENVPVHDGGARPGCKRFKHGIGDVHSNTSLRFMGGCPDVWRSMEAVMGEERMVIGHGFLFKDVESKTGKRTVAKCR